MKQRVSALHPRGATAIAAALRAHSQAVGKLRSARAGADRAQAGYEESVAACTVTERALFAVYQAICRIVGIAVNAAGIPPARISFPHALAAATDTVAAFPP
jgi:hypothetical protein